MAEFIQHRVVAGERWDQVATRYYGDPHRYEPIVAANPHVPIGPVLPEGVELLVPILAEAASTAAALLPPWKR